MLCMIMNLYLAFHLVSSGKVNINPFPSVKPLDGEFITIMLAIQGD